MSEPDLEWIKDYLRRFIAMATPHNLSGRGFITTASGPAASTKEMHAERPVIERILDRFYPEWRRDTKKSSGYEWNQHYEGAMYCLSMLERRAELDNKLGSNAPRMAADAMHPWVWDAARAQWDSHHYAEAVRAAAVNINSRLQNLTGRADLSDKKLVQEALSDGDAKPGRSRLRIVQKDESENYRSMQEGVRAFAVGCFQAIRNPLSHLTADALDLGEFEALERLAALSLLARWLEGAVLEISE